MNFLFDGALKGTRKFESCLPKSNFSMPNAYHPFHNICVCFLPVFQNSIRFKKTHEWDDFSSWLLFLGHLGRWISLEHFSALKTVFLSWLSYCADMKGNYHWNSWNCEMSAFLMLNCLTALLNCFQLLKHEDLLPLSLYFVVGHNRQTDIM